MVQKVSDFLIERLLEWDTKYILDFPVAGTNVMLVDNARAKNKISLLATIQNILHPLIAKVNM